MRKLIACALFLLAGCKGPAVEPFTLVNNTGFVCEDTSEEKTEEGCWLQSCTCSAEEDDCQEYPDFATCCFDAVVDGMPRIEAGLCMAGHCVPQLCVVTPVTDP